MFKLCRTFMFCQSPWITSNKLWILWHFASKWTHLWNFITRNFRRFSIRHRRYTFYSSPKDCAIVESTKKGHICTDIEKPWMQFVHTQILNIVSIYGTCQSVPFCFVNKCVSKSEPYELSSFFSFQTLILSPSLKFLILRLNTAI